MINAISAVSSSTQAAPVAKPSQQAAPQRSKPTPAHTEDSATLSSVAQAALAASKEATETSAQTAKEAGLGDNQAKRLLAKETAAQPVK